jgi:hypothetical protein
MPISDTARYSASLNGAENQTKDEEQRRRRQPAEDADQQLDLHEARDQIALDVARQPRADAHRKEIGADHGRELHHRIAEQIARQRAGDQLVGEPAGGDDENREQQGLIHRGRLLVIRPAARTGEARGLRRRHFEEIPALVLRMGKKGQREDADDEVGLDHLTRPRRLRIVVAAKIALAPALASKALRRQREKSGKASRKRITST